MYIINAWSGHEIEQINLPAQIYSGSIDNRWENSETPKPVSNIGFHTHARRFFGVGTGGTVLGGVKNPSAVIPIASTPEPLVLRSVP